MAAPRKYDREFRERAVRIYSDRLAEQDTVSDVRVADNTFSGCRTQVKLHADKGGHFRRAPCVTGNIGEGVAVDLSGVKVYLVGGSLQTAAGTGEGTPPAGARYCGLGDPNDTLLIAPSGSLYSRIDGAAGDLLYINTDGDSQWVAIA